MEKTKEYQDLLEELRKDLGSSKDGDMVGRVADEVEKRLAKSNPRFSPVTGMVDHTAIPTLGEFAKAVYCKEHNKQMEPEVEKALGESQGSTGGFLLYDEFRPDLQKLIIEDQVVRPNARIIPMAMETVLVPRIVDTSHVSSIHGGVKGTWVAEASTLSSVATGDPAVGQIRLICKKFSDYVLVSNELLMDSPISVTALLQTLLREGLGFFEDVAMLNGTGNGQPLGVLKCPALISATRSKTGHVIYDDIVNMQSRLFPSSWKRGVWVCSPDVFPDLATMSLAVGTGGSAIWVNGYGDPAKNAPPQTLFGRPLIISEKMSALGTTGDIGLFDFTYYLIGDRMELALTSSDQVAFATDQTAFRIIERLDGQPWISSALTPNNASANTLSAFVVLS